MNMKKKRTYERCSRTNDPFPQIIKDFGNESGQKVQPGASDASLTKDDRPLSANQGSAGVNTLRRDDKPHG